MSKRLFYVNLSLFLVIVALASVLLLSPLPYCDEHVTDRCRKCPKRGTCHGLTVECPVGYVSNGLECVRSSVTQTKMDKMDAAIRSILRERMGSYMCSNLTANGVSSPFVKRTDLEESLGQPVR